MQVHKDASPATHNLTVQASRKGRGGKTVTVIDGFVLVPSSMDKLVKELKAKLGTGGAVKGNAIEIQVF